MAKKKDEPEVRTDASGRELYPWEVAPQEQAEAPLAAEGDQAPADPIPGPKQNEN